MATDALSKDSPMLDSGRKTETRSPKRDIDGDEQWKRKVMPADVEYDQGTGCQPTVVALS